MAAPASPPPATLREMIRDGLTLTMRERTHEEVHPTR